MIKQLLKEYLKYFSFFYSIVGYRMFLIITLSLAVGFLDGMGLTMFLPLLEMVDGGGSLESEKLGKLGFILDFFEYINITLNLKNVLLIMLFFFVGKGGARFLEGYIKLLVSQYFIKSMKYRGLELLSRFKYEKFTSINSGRIQSSLTGELDGVTGAFANYMTTMQSFMMLIVYIFLAYLANAQFAFLITLGGLISNLAFRFFYKKTKEISRNLTSIQHGYHNLLIQIVTHFKYLIATGRISKLSQMAKNSIDQSLINGKKMGFYNILLITIREPIIIGVVVLVILIQVQYLGQELGLIILSLLFFYRALNFVMNVQTQWNKILAATGSFENTQKFFNEMSEHQQDNGRNEFRFLEKGISCNSVNFSFGERQVLKDISLTLEKNKTYAFVGESGSGKTTLVNIIAGLLSPLNGEVKIDNLLLSDLNLKQFQNRIGYITQESVIFNDTIFNNVTFWDNKSSENINRFYNAIKQASIFDYVQELPKKQDELLGNNGINLSGGQKQRISIARELYKNVDILIMDEATSALDSETELNIQTSIDKLKGSYTVLMVAHRLSTIKNADQVILMNDGVIEAVGDYKGLIKKTEKFRRMVDLQDLLDN